jgi:alpha-beta hydrolase superfamily lysophospholipase
MSFGYDAAWASSTSVLDIDSAAMSLITRLISERQGLGGQGRPIIFLVHSLGGIVVKRVS